jgi:hypothetical protein
MHGANLLFICFHNSQVFVQFGHFLPDRKVFTEIYTFVNCIEFECFFVLSISKPKKYLRLLYVSQVANALRGWELKV